MHGRGGAAVAILRSEGGERAKPGDADAGLFAQFARHSSNALWIADAASGHFHYLNPAALRMWAGVSPAGLEQWSDRIHPHDRARVARQRARVAEGEPQRLSYRLCDGPTVRPFRETSFPIPADGASRPRVAGIVEDLSCGTPTYLIDRAGEEGAAAAALRDAGLPYRRFGPDEFLGVADSLLTGCAILDLAGVAGDAAAYLQALKVHAPLHAMILVGAPDATQADVIAAMKAGAIDYILHPPSPDALAAAVAAAPVARDGIGGLGGDSRHETVHRLTQLPRREHEVLAGLMGGGTNKTIGRMLGISPRTVEAHRAHLMDRLNVRTLTDLIRVAIAAGFQAKARAEAGAPGGDA